MDKKRKKGFFEKLAMALTPLEYKPLSEKSHVSEDRAAEQKKVIEDSNEALRKYQEAVQDIVKAIDELNEEAKKKGGIRFIYEGNTLKEDESEKSAEGESNDEDEK